MTAANQGAEIQKPDLAMTLARIVPPIAALPTITMA
jgi:hypothetical protein